MDRTAPADADRPVPRWEWGLVFVGCALILAARQPDRLLAVDFVLEDGLIFFAQAYNEPPLTALLTRYAGYYHLIPRLVAALAAPLPLAIIPAVYGYAALALAALATSWFYLPHFRGLIRQDGLRLALVLLLVCAPNVEAPNVIAYSQWFLALWGLGLLLMPAPRPGWLGWLVVAGYWLALGSAPVLVILGPLWLIRAWQARATILRAQALANVAGTALLLLQLLSAPDARAGAPALSTTLLADVVHAFVYKGVTVNLVGHLGAEWLLAHWGWPALYAVALAFALLLAGLLWSMRRHPQRVTLWMLLYVALAAVALYIPRAAYYNFAFVNGDEIDRTLARYFFLAGCALYLLLFAIADHVWRGQHRAPAGAGLLVAYLVVLGLQAATFRLEPWGEAGWPRYSRLLATLEQEQPAPRASTVAVEAPAPAAAGPPAGGHRLWLPLVHTPPAAPPGKWALAAPITPAGWAMTLFVPAQSAPIFEFPEGFTLAGMRVDHQDDAVLLTLFWQQNENLPAETLNLGVTVGLTLDDALGSPPVSAQLAPVAPLAPNPQVTEHRLPPGWALDESPLFVTLARWRNGQPAGSRTIRVESAPP
ncbi:MAG: hypothetical protein KJZ93_00660 [Caldilineaceae bacterium]|nr:hypothetical protein [Caldilineaceae bacterium]